MSDMSTSSHRSSCAEIGEEVLVGVGAVKCQFQRYDVIAFNDWNLNNRSKLEMRGKAQRIERAAPQCRHLAGTSECVLPPGKRTYTYPIADACSTQLNSGDKR